MPPRPFSLRFTDDARHGQLLIRAAEGDIETASTTTTMAHTHYFASPILSIVYTHATAAFSRHHKARICKSLQ